MDSEEKEKDEGSGPKGIGPEYSGVVILEFSGAKKKKRIENATAFFIIDGDEKFLTIAHDRTKTEYPCTNTKTLTGSGTFTLILRDPKRVCIRFTSAENAEDEFYNFCKKLKSAAAKPVSNDDVAATFTTSPKPSPRLDKLPIDTIQDKVNRFIQSTKQLPKPLEDLVRKPLTISPTTRPPVQPDTPRKTIPTPVSPSPWRPDTFYGGSVKRNLPSLPSPESPRKFPRLDNGRLGMTSPTPVRQDGIRNAGQTCYMGSVLQMLYFCPFKDSMQKLFPMSENGKPPIITALCKIFRTRDQHKLVSIDALKKQLGAVAPRFADDHQEDAQEFLSELLSEVNRECILGSSLKAPTPVDSTFMWSVKKTFMCEQCPSQSSTTETYSTLPLDFGERPPGMTDPGVSPSPRARQRHGLHSLVANFFKEELVDRTCEKCGCTKAKTLSRIETLPRVMIIHLKRFQLDTATSRIRKREDLVDVPLRLNMEPWQVNGRDSREVFKPLDTNDQTPQIDENPFLTSLDGNKSSTCEDKAGSVTSPRFSLRSIVSHLGSQLLSGHYVTDVYNEEREVWTKFDDTQVTTNLECSERLRGRTAYLLAYINESFTT